MDAFAEHQGGEFSSPGQGKHINVGREERIASLMGGGFLTAYGLGRRSLGGLALAAAGGALLYRGLTGHCPAYGALGVGTAEEAAPTRGVRMHEAVTVSRPREELYRFWRDFENLPQFMRHLEAVRTVDERISEWRARMPKGVGTVTWEAEITEDHPGERIAWRSLPEADIANSGLVRFADATGGRGTVVDVEIDYRPPAGGLGAAAASLLNPVFSQMVREDIRRFKSLMEAGEVPTTEGQPKGHG